MQRNDRDSQEGKEITSKPEKCKSEGSVTDKMQSVQANIENLTVEGPGRPFLLSSDLLRASMLCSGFAHNVNRGILLKMTPDFLARVESCSPRFIILVQPPPVFPGILLSRQPPRETSGFRKERWLEKTGINP